MQIFAVIAVVIIAFINVMIGLDRAAPPSANSAVRGQAGQATDAVPAASSVPLAVPSPATPAGPLPPVITDGGGTAPIVLPDEPKSADAANASCNVAACAAAYRSFTASDCTYQPLEGPRRLCTK